MNAALAAGAKAQHAVKHLQIITDSGEETMSEPTAKPSSPLAIALAWLVVLIPAAWGVSLTAQRAANLFK
jgi:hypothetical protein